MPEQKAERFLTACRLQPVDKTPVWFMRQAGRIFPEYRNLKQKYDFLTLCHTPELCAEITLLPIAKLGVDAAILFADIMLPLEGLGVDYQIKPGVGPVIQAPLRDQAAVSALKQFEPRETHAYLQEGIRMVKRALARHHQHRPLIGFAGAPFTLACYLIEGRPARDFTTAKAMMFQAPDLWHDLMARLTACLIEYLRAQIEAGVQAVQLFDSWVGGLAPWDYEEYVLPYSRAIFKALDSAGVPRIHFGTGTATLLPSMAAAGSDVMGIDWRLDIDHAWDLVGPEMAVQGNLDPAVLLGSEAVIRNRADRILQRVGGRPGHIFNFGHGMLPTTPLDNIRLLVDHVHQFDRSAAPEGR